MEVKGAIYWIGACSVAAVSMISYVHSYVFTRTEAQTLEAKVERIDTERKQDLRDINDKLDRIYQTLLNRR